MNEHDLDLGDGRSLHVYDCGGDGFPVVWHHGTPNLGTPPLPLRPAATELGLRWVGFDRPGYGTSTADPDRDVAAAGVLNARVADALDLDRFAVMGYSGGGPHALAVAALLPERVTAVVCLAGLAPYDVDGLDWFVGMATSSVAALRAAVGGREAKEWFEAAGVPYDPEFTAADLAALTGEWAWLANVVAPAVAAGPAALIDDDLAFVRPWGFDPIEVTAPTLVVHGGEDRLVPIAHGRWLAHRITTATGWWRPDDGHVSVLAAAPDALAWIAEHRP